MAFSEEIKVKALKNPKIRFAEMPVMYTSRLGEIKLQPWRDGIANLLFLFKKRLQFQPAQTRAPSVPSRDREGAVQ